MSLFFLIRSCSVRSSNNFSLLLEVFESRSGIRVSCTAEWVIRFEVIQKRDIGILTRLEKVLILIVATLVIAVVVMGFDIL